MDEDKIEYYSLSIPLSRFPIYQLLSQKHGLTIGQVKFEKNNSIQRIWFVLDGKPEDKESFYEDLLYSEMYEDRLEKIFTE